MQRYYTVSFIDKTLSDNYLNYYIFVILDLQHSDFIAGVRIGKKTQKNFVPELAIRWLKAVYEFTCLLMESR